MDEGMLDSLKTGVKKILGRGNVEPLQKLKKFNKFESPLAPEEHGPEGVIDPESEAGQKQQAHIRSQIDAARGASMAGKPYHYGYEGSDPDIKRPMKDYAEDYAKKKGVKFSTDTLEDPRTDIEADLKSTKMGRFLIKKYGQEEAEAMKDAYLSGGDTPGYKAAYGQEDFPDEYQTRRQSRINQAQQIINRLRRHGVRSQLRKAQKGGKMVGGSFGAGHFTEQIKNAVLNYLNEQGMSGENAEFMRQARHTTRRFGPRAIASAGSNSAAQARARVNQGRATRRFGRGAWAGAGNTSAGQAQSAVQQRHRSRRFGEQIRNAVFNYLEEGFETMKKPMTPQQRLAPPKPVKHGDMVKTKWDAEKEARAKDRQDFIDNRTRAGNSDKYNYRNYRGSMRSGTAQNRGKKDQNVGNPEFSQDVEHLTPRKEQIRNAILNYLEEGRTTGGNFEDTFERLGKSAAARDANPDAKPEEPGYRRKMFPSNRNPDFPGEKEAQKKRTARVAAKVKNRAFKQEVAKNRITKANRQPVKGNATNMEDALRQERDKQDFATSQGDTSYLNREGLKKNISQRSKLALQRGKDSFAEQIRNAVLNYLNEVNARDGRRNVALPMNQPTHKGTTNWDTGETTPLKRSSPLWKKGALKAHQDKMKGVRAKRDARADKKKVRDFAEKNARRADTK